MTTDLIEPPTDTPAAAALITAIRPEHIRIDGGTQARAGLDSATVAEYVEAMRDLCYVRNGLDRIPPIVVFHDGATYWLADGFHRLAAYKQLQTEARPAPPQAIQADVRQGTRRDAVLFAAGANADHGLRRTTADKERAVLALLHDQEWSQWSDREIARRCRVSHDFVRSVTERHGLSTGRASSERKTADGRTMDVSGIAAANAARAESCARCSNPASGPAGMTIADKRYCARCGGAVMQEIAIAQAEQTAATRQAAGIARTHMELAAKSDLPAVIMQHAKDARAALDGHQGAEVQELKTMIGRQELRVSMPAVPDALRAPLATLQAHGWDVRTDGAEYRLAKGNDAYATDADGVIALARLAAERPDATPDELAAAVSAIDDAPAPVPGERAPILRVTDADGALFERAEASASIGDGYLDRGKMKRPFEYAGKLWISVGGVYGGGYQDYDERECVRVVLEGEPYTPGEVNESFRPGSYTHDRASAGGKNYVLTGQWLIIRRPKQAPAPPEQPTDFATIPADIAASAAALGMAVTQRGDGRLLLAWPDESPDDLVSQSPEQAREWLRDEAPGLAADRQLAAARAGAIPDPAPAVCARSMCNMPSAGKRNIGGTLAERCQGCAARAEEHDLKQQLGAQYRGCAINQDGAWHHIVWDGTGIEGNYTYDEALTMYHSSAMSLRRHATGTATPREAAAAWLGAMLATLQRAPQSTMFRWSEMELAARHVAALLVLVPSEHGPVPTLADLDDPLTSIAAMLSIAERQIAAGRAERTQANQLSACRRALDDLAADETIPTDAYDDLSRRIGDAQRALVELSEAGVEVGV